MFRGANGVTLDTKGRVAIPAKYRKQLQDKNQNSLITTIDIEDNCLLLYPLDTWEKIESELDSLSNLDKRVRRIQRLLIGHATECELDTHGRIRIAPILKEYAGLDKKSMLVGQGKKLELWNESTWLEKRQEWINETLGEELPTEMDGFSF